MSAAAALGLVPHTGWAWLVRVEGSRQRPTPRVRERLVACDVLDAELYHRAAEQERERAAFLDRGRARAVAQARSALAPWLAGVRGVVVLGKQSPLLELERVLASHPRIHGAEGELWRAIFAEASGESGVRVQRAEPAAIRAALEQARGAASVREFLAAAKSAFGSPWSQEPQDAALAAWSALP